MNLYGCIIYRITVTAIQVTSYFTGYLVQGCILHSLRLIFQPVTEVGKCTAGELMLLISLSFMLTWVTIGMLLPLHGNNLPQPQGKNSFA